MRSHRALFRVRDLSFRILAAVMLILAAWVSVAAQETTGAIQGAVTAPDGMPLADVEVVVAMTSTRVARMAVTDKDGGFRITVLPLGEYELTILNPKFAPAKVGPVIVRLGQTTAVPAVKLQPLDSLVEKIEVVAEAPPIDPASTTIGGNISSDVFDNLPVQRDYQSIATLLPNAGVSYLGDPVNIGGATGLENRYFVDGIDMTDPARGIGGTTLPPDFIQEVELKTGGYEAEYRSALGGVINVVTPSGNDRLSGKLFGYWTSHLVSGEAKQSPIALQQKDFAQCDVGFSLSGPLAKDRAWFFIAYDPTHQRVDTEIPGIGYYQDSSTAHRFAGKFDWRITGSNNLALTVVGDPMSRDGIGELPFSFGAPVSVLNADPYLRHIENGGVGISLRGTHVLGSRVLLETAISNLWRKDVNVPATDVASGDVMFIDASSGVWSGGSCCQLDTQNSQLTASVKATWSVGRHELKGGVEYRVNREILNAWDYETVLRFADDSYSVWAQHVGGTLQNLIPSLFVQDSWRIGSRWVLNVGLRWSQERLGGASGDAVQTIDDEWQPRLGFVFLPGRIGTQRIVGSAARYYQELWSGSLYLYVGGDGFQRFCGYDHDPRLDPTGGDCLTIPVTAQPEVRGLRGDYSDEYSLGYQRQIGERHRAGVRAIYRTLGDGIEDGLVTETGTFVWGNPGRGALAADYPRASRVYKALEFTFEGQPTPRSGFLASYVLSENSGNYMGLYNTDFDYPFPNTNGSFDFPEQLINGDGPLPNDRTHVLKGAGFYRFDSGFNLGGSVLWESGTPLNEFGACAYGFGGCFLLPRGTAGRTPSIFDLSLRLDYTFLRNSPGRWKPRLILDVYHLFSGRRAVDYDQSHYFNQDAEGIQIDPNPTYGMATRYYPPATARLGFEVTF